MNIVIAKCNYDNFEIALVLITQRYVTKFTVSNSFSDQFSCHSVRSLTEEFMWYHWLTMLLAEVALAAHVQANPKFRDCVEISHVSFRFILATHGLVLFWRRSKKRICFTFIIYLVLNRTKNKSDFYLLTTMISELSYF